MRAGKIDRRTAPAKALERVVAVLVADWGGSDAMPGAARLLADRLGVLTVRLMLREQRLMREAAHGIDDPTSDKHTIALHNAFSRSIQRLEEMRAREQARGDAGLTLSEYLEGRGNGHATAAEPADTAPLEVPVEAEAEAVPPAAPAAPVQHVAACGDPGVICRACSETAARAIAGDALTEGEEPPR